MRAACLLVPLLFVSVACSASDEGDAGDSESSGDALTSGCSMSRSEILSSTSAGRRRAIERGFGWLDENVPYSQTGNNDGYRTDCSGFISMCWELSQSFTTVDFYSGGGESQRLEEYDDLLPGDALVRRGSGSGHMVLFLGWNDTAKKGACVLEEASKELDMEFRVRTTSSLRSGGYRAIRADALSSDTEMPVPAEAEGGDDGDYGDDEPPAPPPADDGNDGTGGNGDTGGGTGADDTCASDSDCNLGTICLSGYCVPGCYTDSDCAASTYCEEGECL
jgi:hypothetical protein